MDLQYQYIVLGGGAAGCPLAATLAKNGRTLLLERGPVSVRDKSNCTCCDKDAATWHRTEGGSWAATANVLGGGSAINAGVFMKEAIDSPFFQAHPFLETDKVQQAYVEVTKTVSHERTASTLFGTDMVAAMKDIGLGKEVVRTNTTHYGIYHPSSLFDERGIRSSAVDFLPLQCDATSEYLTVKTDIRVTRVVFDAHKPGRPRAIGFEYEDLSQVNPTTKLLLQPSAHYFLSCGAIHTPRLLMLSGVGNAADLSRHNIPVVLDQPHVGQHLKDKAVVAISLSSSRPVAKTVVDTMASTPDFTIGTASGGRLASYIGPSTLAMIPKPHRTSTARRTASWVLGLLPQALLKVVNQQITMYTMLSNPTSEGSVELSSADVHAEPMIRTAGYQTSEEVEAAAKGLAVISALIQSPSLYKYARSIADLNSTLFRIAGRVFPERVLSHYSQPNKQGPTSPLTFPILPNTNIESPGKKQKLQSWLNNMHSEGWTYTGTCRFDDVVNRDFTVKGIEGLSIVDASVLKRPTRVNGQATMMMMGIYAGNMITAGC
jgi:choline dehydrogenase-like flavoprotein